MRFIDWFRFPGGDEEFDFLLSIKRKCYDSYYPFQVLPKRGLKRIDFEPVTILYGGNGSGKSTVLNIISEKLELERDAVYNRSNFFADYVRMCRYELANRRTLPRDSRIITSDDVFDFMLNLRNWNEGIDEKREELFQEYLDNKYADFQFHSMEDYDKLKKVNQARSKTQSKYVRANVMGNIRERSNGESAFAYFTEKIKEKALYLLDEPENSLSVRNQMELTAFLENSARFFDCQFVIATHSPFFLAMRGAKIYDLDEDPVDVKKWTELESVRAYYEFFDAHSGEF